jgi:hypothetical protein
MTIARKKSFVQFLFVWLVGSAIVWLGFCFLYGFFKAPKLTVMFVWLPIFSAFWPVWIWFSKVFEALSRWHLTHPGHEENRTNRTRLLQLEDFLF